MEFIDKDKTVIGLYVKASTLDKRNIDANPVDQQYFMAFQLLDRSDRLILHEVVTISAESPPKDYVALNVGNSLPVVNILHGPKKVHLILRQFPPTSIYYFICREKCFHTAMILTVLLIRLRYPK